MTFLQAIILGIVEGLTEFLPVSSTAHLLLVEKAMGIALTEQMVTFTIAVQLGSILAAGVLYVRQFLSIQKNSVLIIALLPTIFAGIFIHPYIKVFFSQALFIIPWTLFLGGILMLIGEDRFSKKVTNTDRQLTVKEKFMLGCAQTVALIPGVSRSAAMIVTGLFANLPRTAVTSFTFILAVPTMFSATVYDIYRSHLPLKALLDTPFLIGFFVAFGVALISIRLMLFIVGRYRFIPFAWYRIILGLSLGLLVYL